MNALVSIVLPTYNRSGRLAGAIRSCLSQTHDRLEVIVVDDGSTDDTSEVVEAIRTEDPRVSYFRQQNKKLPAALNAGHRRAQGDYITWTSDDNRYEPDAIALMVNHLKSKPETGLVYCEMQAMGPDGSMLGPYDLLPPEKLSEHSCIGACFLYRRSVYEAIGDYSIDTFLAEDYDYWLRIQKQFRIDRLDGKRPYRYGVHADSLTSKRQADVIVQTAKARCRHVVPAREHRRVMAEANWSALWHQRSNGNAAAAWTYARECVRLMPLSVVYWKGLLGTLVLLATGRTPSSAPKASRGAA